MINCSRHISQIAMADPGFLERDKWKEVGLFLSIIMKRRATHPQYMKIVENI